MTVTNAENSQETILNTQKVDTAPQTQNVDTSLDQQTEEAKQQKNLEEDENFKAFREGRKKDRAEREEALRRATEKEQEIAALKAAMEAAFAKQPAVPGHFQYAQVSLPDETEDERLEKKIQAAIAAREADAERQRQQREQQEYPVRLQQSYPDFNQMISQENLDYLDYHYPEVARPLNRLRDGFDKWSDIYQAIKKFVPNANNAKREAMKADINQNKPKSISSTGITQSQPLPGSNILTEEKRAANWARMQQVMKGVG